MKYKERPIPEDVYVPGEGNQGATIAFVGEGPGKMEAIRGRPFVGPSGKLLWQFSIKYMGLHRKDVYVTNLVKVRLTDAKGKDRAPTAAEKREWGKSLRKELLGLPNLKYIIAYGRHSASVLLRRPVNMEAVHGLPFSIGVDYSKGPGHGPKVITIFHPAAGLHQEKMLPYTARGMQMAAEVIKGKGPQAFMNPPGDVEYKVGLPKELPTQKGDTIGMDTEGAPNPWSVQVSWEPRKAYLIRADDERELGRLRGYIRKFKPTIALHYALHDFKTLLKMGIDLLPDLDAGRVRDTLIYAANRTADPGELKSLAERYLRVPVKRYEEIVAPVREKKLHEYIFDVILGEYEWPEPIGRAHSIPKRLTGITKKSKAVEPRSTWKRWRDKKFKGIREKVEEIAGKFPGVNFGDLGEDFKDYACADPDYTRTVYLLLRMKAREEGLEPAITMDHAALPLIERMERAGMRFDKKRAALHMVNLRLLRGDTREAAEMLTDGEVKNPSSSHEVQRWCVDTMKFPLTRLTKGKTKESTDDDALKSIRNLHPAINYFIEYRAAVKQIGIMEPLPGLVDPDGRLRYRFNYGKVRTGRRSMGGGDEEEANLLAFPKRGPLGKGARKCFVAEEGKRFGSCDASQIELRVAAGLSQDPEMMENYRKDEDLHARTAVRLSGCTWDEAQNNDDIRIPFKTANFALLYGASDETLHKTYVSEGITRYSVKDCADIIRDWFKLYKGIATFFKWCTAEARRTGYITTPYGRKRMLPAIDLRGDGYPMEFLREGDERKAANTPIQGGAFELIKRAEARIAQILRVEGDWFTPVLEIHDDLMFEFETQFEENVRTRVQAAMEADSPFRGVPIKTDWKAGPSWGELTKDEIKKPAAKNKSRR